MTGKPTERGYAAIGLASPKMDCNVGGAVRAAQCFGAKLIIVKGQRYKHVPADTTKSARHIPLIHTEDFSKSTPDQCVRVAVEIVDGATSIRNYTHPDRALYIFGPEDGSLEQSVLARARDKIYIPTHFCLNLAATVNIVLFDRMMKRGNNDR